MIYNEIDPYAVQWLKNLQEAGHIPRGHVFRKPIQRINPYLDVSGTTTFHAFAGIAGWAQALKMTGWPEREPVWTGSCPCQPFSSAGKGKGTDDERHLWPEWFRLIEVCKPTVIFGEQVASPAGRTWLSAVQTDLEALGYTFGAADLCAAGVGAPHVRQRLWFVAHTDCKRFDRLKVQLREESSHTPEAAGSSSSSDMANAQRRTSERYGHQVAGQTEGSSGETWEQRIRNDAWNGSAIECSDGKRRPIESGTKPLVDGFPCRVGQLRAYGNAIVPQVAAKFIKAFMETIRDEQT